MAKKMLKEILAANQPQFEGLFRVSKIEVMQTKTGKDYLRMELSDKSGQIPSVLWDFNGYVPKDGEIFSFDGTLGKYKDQMQVTIKHFLLPESVGAHPDPTDFERRTAYAIEEMFMKVIDLVGSFKSKWIKEVADGILLDDRYLHSFQHGPAATGMHHAFKGGLLEHTWQMLEMGDTLLKLPFMSPLNRDLCLFGLLFHDFGKIFEYKQDGTNAKALQGVLVPHIPMVAAMIYEKANALGVPEIVRDHLMHVVLAHHGRIDFGSPVSMNIPEAAFIHYIDHMHGDVFGWLQKIEREAKPGDELVKGNFGQNTLVAERFSDILKKVESAVSAVEVDETNLPF